VDQAVGLANVANLRAVVAAALEPFGVDAPRSRRLPGNHHVGRNVQVDAAVHAQKSVRADTAELMGAGVAGEDHPVTNDHVAGQGGAIGKGGVRAHLAVVGDVAVGHQPVVVADAGHANVVGGDAVDGHILADGVVTADLHGGVFAVVFLVLWSFTDGRKLVDAAVAADAGAPADDNMRPDPAAVADDGLWPDDAVGANGDIAADLRAFFDDGGAVDHGVGSGRAAHRSSALATGLSSTSVVAS